MKEKVCCGRERKKERERGIDEWIAGGELKDVKLKDVKKKQGKC